MSPLVGHRSGTLFATLVLAAGVACSPGSAGPNFLPDDGVDAAPPALPDAADGASCMLGEEPRPCDYNGPPETEGVGVCHAAVMECVPEDEFAVWSACSGEVLPGEEICDDGLDNDCDGLTDENCP